MVICKVNSIVIGLKLFVQIQQSESKPIRLLLQSIFFKVSKVSVEPGEFVQINIKCTKFLLVYLYDFIGDFHGKKMLTLEFGFIFLASMKQAFLYLKLAIWNKQTVVRYYGIRKIYPGVDFQFYNKSFIVKLLVYRLVLTNIVKTIKVLCRSKWLGTKPLLLC